SPSSPPLPYTTLFRSNENGSNTAVGAATIALRGFDARATLILLDGRRVAPYPTGNRRVVFIDLNTIPESSIQSIEILKDGASTRSEEHTSELQSRENH